MYKKAKNRNPIVSLGIINIKLNNESNYIKEFNEIIEKIQNYNNINLYNIIKLQINNINKKLYYEILNDLKKNIMFLLVKKRNSLEFIEFIKGKYNINNDLSYINLLNYMTNDEINILKNNNFNDIWNNLWNKYENNNETIIKNNLKYEIEFKNSKEKFDNIDKQKYNHINTIYSDTEWGFPKGKKNKYESDIDCAIREFIEETNINNILILNNIIPINEIFLGTNNVKYKHIYFISISNNDNILDKTFLQKSCEISDIEWFNFENANIKIRSYHIKKKIIIMDIIKFISILIYKNII